MSTPSSAIPLKVSFPASTAQVTAVTAGSSYTCATLSDETAVCWGSNSSGQLGNPSIAVGGSSTPVKVLKDASTTLSGVKSLSAGYDFTCAVVTDATSGTVAKCWGNGSGGELGYGDTASKPYPVNVMTNPMSPVALANVRSLSAGYDSACATTGDNKVYCWGWNDSGQLGVGSGVTNSSLALAVPDASGNLSSFSSVMAGKHFACAVLLDSSVECWGDNSYGTLGNGSAVSFSNVAVPVTLSFSPLRMAVGYVDACVVNASGQLYCWGDGEYDQFGRDYSVSPCNDNSYACNSQPGLVTYSASYASQDLQVAIGNNFISLLDGHTRIFTAGNNGIGQFGSNDLVTSYTYDPQEIYYSWTQ